MNRKLLLASAASLILAAGLSACATRDSANNYAGFSGSAVQPSSTYRTVVIGPDTSYVNVTQGDVVNFVIGGTNFTWNFDVSSNIHEIDLNKLAPAGTLNHVVKVYIEQNDIYKGA
jgi:hypothetical protein